MAPGPTPRPTDTHRQLAFDLAREPCYDPEEFLLSASNADAHAMVTRWPAWPDRVLLLLGAAGTGKSHLGAIWASRCDARIIRSAGDVAIPPWPAVPVALIEDCDRTAFSEPALFHLINATRERAGWLLVTAREPPDRWAIRTPDLLSRLRLAPSVVIGAPDAALLRAVLVKLFLDRQIRVDEDVVRYAALHCEQSLGAMRDFVAAIDDAALSANRRITRPLVAAMIAKLGSDPSRSNDDTD